MGWFPGQVAAGSEICFSICLAVVRVYIQLLTADCALRELLLSWALDTADLLLQVHLL